jgi:glycine/D-amino acid oxidase-like deaminating enzyme/nitrite reductase/ring-hydroxylating ferredoxin subunit
MRGMKSPDGVTKPLWTEIKDSARNQKPPKKLSADVCVVGAGIAGLSVAYLLAKEGKSVVILDEGKVGAGQTERTSAHLASAIDDRFVEIEKLHGEEGSRFSYESHAKAIDTIERIARDEKIECEFKRLDAFLFSLPSDPKDLLDKELEAAKRAGFSDAKKENGKLGPCIRFPRQGRFHPLKYLYGLEAAFKKLGGKIYVGSRVRDVQEADPKKDKPAIVTLEGSSQMKADAVAVCTSTPAPINDWMGIYLKQASYRSYVIACEIPKGSVDDALYWDTGDPYHYVRIEPREKNDLLIVGGEDHKVGQFAEDAAPFMRLLAWAKEKFPMIGEEKFRWSGQVQEPDDGVAFIGKAPTKGENVYVCTGDSGMGLTHGTIAGLLITDLILGRENPWEKLYDPNRKQSNRDFIKENLNAIAQYKDLVTGGEVSDVKEIPPGEGRVMREGMHKLAVYRDEAGKISKHSAVCTHLQCIVQWNHVEKSWDCPCHGSRFDPKGKVLMGPAVDDLPGT